MQGHDKSGCGSITYMCKSIAFAISQRKSDSMVVYLDGGQTQPFTYLLSESIQFKGLKAIIQMNGSIYKPTIKGNGEIYQIEFLSAPSFRLESIRLNFINIVSYFSDKRSKNSTVAVSKEIHHNNSYLFYNSIKINNCIIDSPSQETTYMIVAENSNLDISFDNVLVRRGGKFLFSFADGNGNVSLFINNSVIYEASIFFHPKQGSLIIENTKFVGNFKYICIIEAYVISGTAFKLKNVDFRYSTTEVSSIYLSWIKFAEISGCKFGYSSTRAIQAEKTSLSISNCTFESLTGLSVIVTEAPEFVNIAQCIFRNIRTVDVLRVTATAHIELKNSVFRNCSASLVATGVKLFQITSSQFIRNSVSGQILSIITSFNSNIIIWSSNFLANCGVKGGVVSAIDSTVQVFSSIFVENYAKSAGTFYIGNNSSLLITDSAITSPQKVLPLLATVIESIGNSITFKNVNITVQASHDSIDMLLSSTNIQISNLRYLCPTARNVEIDGSNTVWSCIYCSKGEYSLEGGSVSITNYNSYNISQNISNASCTSCPLGGLCDRGIVSRSNFWGYIHKKKIRFISCITGYCCDNARVTCSSISTCNENRKGSLCGSCSLNHFVNFFSNDCIHNKYCTHSTEFWIIYFVCVVALFLFVAYMKEIFEKLNKLSCFKHTHEKPTASSPSRSLHLANDSLENFPDEPETNTSKSNDEETESTGIYLGILKILINFYQIEMLIRVSNVNFSSRNISDNFLIVQDIVQTLFTIKLTVRRFSVYFCPMKNLDVVNKTFIKEVLFILLELGFIVLLYFMHKTVKYVSCLYMQYLMKKKKLNDDDDTKDNENSKTTATDNHKVTNGQDTTVNFDKSGSKLSVELKPARSSNESFRSIESNRPNETNKPKGTFDIRCKVVMLQVLLVGYTNITTFSLQMINCVKVMEDYRLFIDGNITCLTLWQFPVIILFFIWVLPFSLTLYCSARLLRQQVISVNEFLKCIVFPPILIFLSLTRHQKPNKTRKIIPDVDHEKEHILSVLEEPFSLKKGKHVLWDPVIVGRRLVIAIISTFQVNLVYRLCSVFPVLILFLLHHCRVFPYKSDLLNTLESFCLTNLCFLGVVNLFRAFVYTYDIPYHHPTDVTSGVFNILEYTLIILPPVSLISCFLFNVVSNILPTLYKKNNRKHD